MAGEVGVCPRPFSFGELVDMATGRRAAEWARTASIMALMFNVNRDAKRVRPKSPAEFMPAGLGGPRPQAGRVGIPLTVDTLGAFEGLIKRMGQSGPGG